MGSIASSVSDRAARRRPGSSRGAGLALAAWWLASGGGCSAPPPVFPPVDPPIVWPSNGDPPRYAYQGKIEGEADLKRPHSVWSWLGSVVGGEAPPAALAAPYCAVLSPSGVLYVSDPEARIVHAFDLEGRGYRAFGDAAEGLAFHTPVGLALDGERLLVADRGLRLIAALSLDGEPVATVGSGTLEGPVGIAVGPRTRRIYAVDVPAHQLKVFEPDGRLALAIGRRGVEPGEFNYPTFVACDGAEEIYVCDSLNFRVQAFDRGGRHLRSWGQKGDTPGSFSQPKGIAIDRSRRVYVVDAHFENVQVFERDGTLLLAFGGEGTGPGQFWLPVGISLDHRDGIWIGDAHNKRVQVFRSIGLADAGGKP